MSILLRIFLSATLVSVINSAIAGPLHDAARDGKPSKISRLINKGADVNAVNYFGLTPLLLAELNGHPQSASLLQSHGAINKKDSLIKTLQHYLVFLGFTVGPPDGSLGVKTEAALRTFQRQQKLPANGKLSEDTVIRLHRQTMAKVQTWLQQQSIYQGEIDGLMGPTTEQALLTAERNFGLTASGRLSPELLSNIRQRPTSTNSKTSTPTNQTQNDDKTSQTHSIAQLFRWEADLKKLSPHFIKVLQSRLSVLGYDPGQNAKLDAATMQAISAFQKTHKLTASDTFDEKWLTVLDTEFIRRIQKRLNAQGFAAGPADGKLGPATEKAIQAWQQKVGLPVNGMASDQILAILNQQLIATVQSRLLTLGYNIGRADGKLGAKSSKAIRAFERLNGLTETGQASVQLAKRLQTAINNRQRARASRQQQQISSNQLLSTITANTTKQTLSSAIPELISKNATSSPQIAAAGNSEIQGPLRFQRTSDGTLLGCSIKGIQLENTWCQPFLKRKQTDDCKVILRANSSVLLVKCQ